MTNFLISVKKAKVCGTNLAFSINMYRTVDKYMNINVSTTTMNGSAYCEGNQTHFYFYSSLPPTAFFRSLVRHNFIIYNWTSHISRSDGIRVVHRMNEPLSWDIVSECLHFFPHTSIHCQYLLCYGHSIEC